MFDVAIVGYGPVGQVLAGLLGQAGHKVAVLERHRGMYPLPRAVRCDGEVLRTLQRLGVVDAISHELLPVERYVWFGADGDPILTIQIPLHPSGHPDCLFHQPTLETELRSRVAELPNVTVMLGVTVTAVSQSAESVTVTGTDEHGAPVTVAAQYLVGADGANSVVRAAAGLAQTDLGFSEHWLVVDVRPHNMADFAHLETASQICDPRRPVTVVGNGRNHRRWEFMLLPTERPEDFAAADRVWELLAGVTGPDRVELVRHSVYNFRSLVAERLQHGRMFLAGDAAHVMPPFMGEGLCTGVRDANNLAWKLDLVLTGRADRVVLDSYTPERMPFVFHSISVSMEMGKVSCELNPAAAARRDQAMRTGEAPPPPPPPIMTGPLAGVGTLAGTISTQPTLVVGGADVRGDSVCGDGFQILVTAGDPTTMISAQDRDWFASIGTVHTFDEAVPGHLVDADGRFTDWLEAAGVAAVLIRPDQYVAASGADPADAAALVRELRTRLGQ